MNTNRLNAAVLSAATAFTLAVAFAPQQAAAQDAAPTQTVAYDDLDLSSEAGAITLNRRIMSAVRKVCPYTGTSTAGYMASRACRKQALNGANAQRDVVLARAKSRGGTPALASAKGSGGPR